MRYYRPPKDESEAFGLILIAFTFGAIYTWASGDILMATIFTILSSTLWGFVVWKAVTWLKSKLRPATGTASYFSKREYQRRLLLFRAKKLWRAIKAPFVGIYSLLAALLMRKTPQLVEYNVTTRKLPPGLRFKVLQRDKFKCRYCGRTADETTLEVDHITPVSKGGSNAESNLITACRSCNRGKSNRPLPPETASHFRKDEQNTPHA